MPPRAATRWRRYLVPPAKVTGTSKSGLDKLGPSGVAVWNSPLVDARRGLLIFATGDNYSLPATGLSDAVVALDLGDRAHPLALSGPGWRRLECRLRVQDQRSCPDENAPDFDFGAGTVLAKGGNGRDYVLAGQKSGWVYALDPATGRLAWKTRVGRGSPSGGVHFGMAASDGRLFVPITDHFAFGPTDFPASPGALCARHRDGRHSSGRRPRR